MDMLVFTIPVPASSKNSRILVRGKSGRPMSLPSKAARKSAEEIKAAAIRALDEGVTNGKLTIRDDALSLFGDDDVGVSIDHHVEDDTVTVRVWSLGERPKVKRTGRRRDLQNLQDGVLDHLQGIAFDDDRQVTMLHMKRVLGKRARWVVCEHCGEWWCSHHDAHTSECDCPGVEELDFDPYTERGP